MALRVEDSEDPSLNVIQKRSCVCILAINSSSKYDTAVITATISFSISFRIETWLCCTQNGFVICLAEAALCSSNDEVCNDENHDMPNSQQRLDRSPMTDSRAARTT